MKRASVFLGFVIALGLSTSAFAADKKVERLWKSKCSACHGMDGKGETEKGKKMLVRDLGSADIQKEDDAHLKKVITEGTKGEKNGVKQEMDAFGEELKPADVDALVAFIRELKK